MSKDVESYGTELAAVPNFRYYPPLDEYWSVRAIPDLFMTTTTADTDRLHSKFRIMEPICKYSIIIWGDLCV